jgi:hypothetical protein
MGERNLPHFKKGIYKKKTAYGGRASPYWWQEYFYLIVWQQLEK